MPVIHSRFFRFEVEIYPLKAVTAYEELIRKSKWFMDLARGCLPRLKFCYEIINLNYTY